MKITLQEAKEYLRVDYGDEDELIASLIESAQSLCMSIARIDTSEDFLGTGEIGRIATLYTVGYLYEHRGGGRPPRADPHPALASVRHTQGGLLMKIGLLNVRIDIEKSSVVSDKYGNRRNEWLPYYSCHATASAESPRRRPPPGWSSTTARSTSRSATAKPQPMSPPPATASSSGEAPTTSSAWITWATSAGL